ncbi:guanine-1-methyltransferase-domain-containing protein [Suillus clintonianus]|uniref:guanine-1-methyltransferase-domain-containing protein n=1 Tax=Suillus clintonianus TaxID=1904413 RepID=UPI001B879F0A|nr:guanine-1-methyltransferase-domain-containing protein [Suillus clintonianus]KAG2156368.1 guanine-1-methyltransferase-domain-containing protein [Suillus clintonianus]
MMIMEQPVTAQGEESSSQPLSKNAQKRVAKAARLQEQKVERRAREKEAKKRKRRERAQAGDAEPRKRRKMGGLDQTSFAAQVVIDLGFDDMMTDKEVTSLTSQLAYTYSANRRSPTPFTSLLFTSLNGRTKARLDAINDAGHKRWTNTEWWEEGYDRIWTSKSNSCDGDEDLDGRRASVVYLTADSEDELMELKEGEIYVIGGICDHNRYKNLCLDKAQTSSIRHARLPIGRYIASLTTRKVLTVNQVFEILLKWVETRDWEQAFWSVIPKRKFQGKTTGPDATPEGEHVEEDEGQEDGDRVQEVASGEDGEETLDPNLVLITA